MRAMLRPTLAAAAFVILALASTMLAAQSTPIRQIKLTQQLVEGFIAAQNDMGAIADQMQGSTSDKPDPKIQAMLEAAAKKHGFKSFNEYDDAAATIMLVMAGFDPTTRMFTEPPEAIKKEIAAIQADKTMSEGKKRQALDELNEASKLAQPIQFPGNIDLVRKYYEKLETIMR